MIRNFLFILIISLFLFNLKAETFLSGIPKVIDGDTIKINDISIRLHGIDTPERNQKCKDKNNLFYFCGRVATKALISIIDKTVINCDEKEINVYTDIHSWDDGDQTEYMIDTNGDPSILDREEDNRREYILTHTKIDSINSILKDVTEVIVEISSNIPDVKYQILLEKLKEIFDTIN